MEISLVTKLKIHQCVIVSAPIGDIANNYVSFIIVPIETDQQEVANDKRPTCGEEHLTHCVRQYYS
jgi:hypothetical protein